MSEREDGIRAALASLGPTADDMAASLRAAGITGVREDGEHCPLANYLRREGFDDINVTRTEIEDVIPLRNLDDEDAFRNRWTMPTPPTAREFIERFDGAFGQPDYTDLADEA